MTRAWRRAKEFLSIKNKESANRRVLRRFFPLSAQNTRTAPTPITCPRLTAEHPAPMIKPTLVVLAAGLGSRFGGLKQTIGFGPNGETLLDYSVFDALRSGFGKVVFVIRREFADAFRRDIAARFEPHIAVTCVFQERESLPQGQDGAPLVEAGVVAARLKPWGTGQATLAARPAVSEPFGVINADDFYGRESFEKLGTFLSQPNLDQSHVRTCLVAFTVRKTRSDHGRVARGVCQTTSEQLLLSVVEKTRLWSVGDGAENRPETGPVESFTGNEPVSLNTWGFAPSIFAELDRLFGEFLIAHGRDPDAEFFLPFAVDQLIQEKREPCRVIRSDAAWFGVTYREDADRVRASLARLHLAGEYPAQLWP